MSFPGYDPVRSVVLLKQTGTTATVSGTKQTSAGRRSAHFIINITAGAALSIVFKIQGWDQGSDTFYDILASAALTGAGQTVLKVFPGATAAANLAVNDIIPGVFRVRAEHGNATAATYTVTGNFGE